MTVRFTESVVGAESVTNYELRRAGFDGLLLSSESPINPTTVTMVGSIATLAFPALTEDVWRLTVKDAVTDLIGNALDGDNDGIAGGNWRRDFVSVSNSPAAGFSRSRLTNGSEISNATGTIAMKFTNLVLADSSISMQSNGTILANRSGLFHIEGQFDVLLDSGPYALGQIVVNGNMTQQFLFGSSTNWSMAHFGTNLALNTGDIVQIVIDGTRVLAIDNGPWSELNITAVNTIEQTPALGFSRSRLTNGSEISSATGTIAMKFTNLVLADSSISMQSNGTILANRSGLFHIEGQFDVLLDSGPYAVGQIVVNGNMTQQFLFGSATNWSMAHFGTNLALNTGDIVQIVIDGTRVLAIDNGPWSELNITAVNKIQDVVSLAGAGGARVTLDARMKGSGQMLSGVGHIADGLGRLTVGASDYAPVGQVSLVNSGQSAALGGQLFNGVLNVSRKATLFDAGSQLFTRTIETIENAASIQTGTQVTVVGNLGSDAATVVFATSDGDTVVEPTDLWFGTDDADGSGTPAIIHWFRGPYGILPSQVIVTEDNVMWEFLSTLNDHQTTRLANFTIIGSTRAEAVSTVNALYNINGFTGLASAFLTPTELASLSNFQFNSAPTDLILSETGVNENRPVGSIIADLSTTDSNADDSFAYSFVSGVGDADNGEFSIVGNQLRVATRLDFENKSSYSVRIRSTDQGGLAVEKALAITIFDLPEIVGAAVNADGSVQRSLVQQVVVTLDGEVNIASGAFLIDKLGPGGGSVTTTIASIVNLPSQTVVTLSFNGAFVRGVHGALTDGYYQLTIDASKVTRDSKTLDSNADGIGGDDYLFGAEEADGFFALYGDTNGDGLVGVAEFGQFRNAFGKSSSDAGYNALFDFEQDGVVGITDFGQFRSRFGKSKLAFR